MKKFTSVILAITIIVLSVNVSVFALNTDMVGKYITFGKYNNTPVTYKIWGTYDVDNDGDDELFLAPEEVLFQKAYNTQNAPSWRESSLRAYLNDDQEGFMSGFSDDEKALVASVTHNTLFGNSTGSTGGNCYFLNSTGAVSNWGVGSQFNALYEAAEATDYKYDNAYYIESTDKIFIPSIKDTYDYQILPNIYNNCHPDITGLPEGTDSTYFWFRDNQAGNNMWRYDNTDGKLKTIPAPTYDSLWVRPAFYIEPDFDVRGSGTKADPYRISKGVEFNLSIKQNGVEVTDTLSNGEIAVDGSVWLNLNDEAYTLNLAVIEAKDDKETMVDFEKLSLTNETDNTVSLSLQSTGSNCYISIYVLDESGKLVNSQLRKGVSSAVKEQNRTKNEFSVDASVSEKSITIKGDVPNDDVVLAVIARKDNPNIIAYSNYISVPSSKSFDLTVNIDTLFGGVAEIYGWYKVYLTGSESSDDCEIGVAGEEMYTGIISKFNDGKWDELKKIFTKDEEYLLEYSAVSGKGYYEEEYTKNSGIISSAFEKMAQNKPEAGWTKENIVDDFNRYITYSYFEAATSEEKFAICQDERYSKYLGTGDIANESYYKTLAESKVVSVFDGVTSENIVDKLSENIILAYIKISENSEQVRQLIENKRDKIGIVFKLEYNNLTQKQLKKLYDKLLGNEYETMEEVALAFDSAYNYAKEVETVVSSGGSSSGGGGGSSRKTTITASMPVATPLETLLSVETKTEEDTLELADIKELTWGQEEIKALFEKGIVSGDENGMFNPDKMITREEIAKIFAIAFDIKKSGDVYFSDVSEDKWYYDYVTNLAGNGIIKGISDNLYGVGNLLTREDMAVMLYRILKLDAVDSKSTLADADKISDYALDAVNTLCSANIISGYEDNTFRPLANITRREAVVLIHRALGGKK